MRQRMFLLIMTLLTAAVLTAGCGQASGEGSQPASPQEATKQAASATQNASQIKRIAFIDQEQACDCTRTRIEASWAALQTALGTDSTLTVERIHRDTQEERAEEFRMLRPMVTVPGIYLLDENGAIVELLQGEVTVDELRTALGSRG